MQQEDHRDGDPLHFYDSLFSDYDSCGAAALCRAAAVFMKETAVELS